MEGKGPPQTIQELIKAIVDDIWDEYDEDGNGELDKVEAKDFLARSLRQMQHEYYLSNKEFDAFWKECDADGSGTIDKEEMAAFLMKVQNLKSESKKLDLNNDGVVDKEEAPVGTDNAEAHRFASFFESK